jgi:macrolide transport system ATP-binding/permease protein
VRKCNISHVKQLLNENSRYNSNGRTFGEFCLSNTVDNEKMSGGELTKIKIIQSLEENAPLYFLDEPTSNLDTNSANIVYGILERIDSFILVSHDRGLLDALCTKIWEVKKGEIQEYPGNFSNYLACQSIKEIEEWREYENYINEKKRLSNIADEKRKMAAKVVKKPQQHVG